MNIRRGSLTLLFLASSALLASSGSVKPTVPPEAPLLFKPSHATIPPHEPDPSVLREVALDVKPGLARDPQAKSLRVALFDGAPLELSVPRRKLTKQGYVILSGHIVGQPASSVVLAVGKSVLIGNIATQVTDRGADYYEIRYLGGGRHVLRQYDPSTLASEADPSPPEPAASPGGAAADEPLDDPCTPAPPTTIDALIVYTPKARAAVGGTEAMELAIELYLRQLNDSFANSGVVHSVQQVGMREVTYDETNSTPESDRNTLRAPGGKLGDVQVWREQVGADIVGLLVEYTKTETDKWGCGYSYVMETVSPAFESWAYAAIPRICADRSYSLTHEFGHIMGARHDWYVDEDEDPNDKPFLFAHGYVHLSTASDPGPAFRTVMAKKDKCTDQHKKCDRVLFWSNPDVQHTGSSSPMGTATGEQPSNNARVLNCTAATVAGFRPHVP